jgi:hypothetical protein
VWLRADSQLSNAPSQVMAVKLACMMRGKDKAAIDKIFKDVEQERPEAAVPPPRAKRAKK